MRKYNDILKEEIPAATRQISNQLSDYKLKFDKYDETKFHFYLLKIYNDFASLMMRVKELDCQTEYEQDLGFLVYFCKPRFGEIVESRFDVMFLEMYENIRTEFRDFKHFINLEGGITYRYDQTLTKNLNIDLGNNIKNRKHNSDSTRILLLKELGILNLINVLMPDSNNRRKSELIAEIFNSNPESIRPILSHIDLKKKHDPSKNKTALKTIDRIKKRFDLPLLDLDLTKFILETKET